MISKIDYKLFKDRLYSILLGESHYMVFMELINDLHGQGFTKKEISSLFLEFFKDIQVDSRTKHDDILYDKLADFIDGFYYNKGFIILPDESKE